MSNKEMKKTNKNAKLTQKVKAYNKVNSNIITLSIIYTFFIIICAVLVTNNAVAEYKKTYNPAQPIKFELKLPFDTAHDVYFEDFIHFPLNKASFDESVDHFCAQKGMQYGNGNRSSLAAAYFGPANGVYHLEETNLANKLVKGVSSKTGS